MDVILNERELYLQKRKMLYQKNKEKISRQNKDRYLRKKDQYLDYRKGWKIKNKEKVKETNRLYNIKTKEWRAIKGKIKRNENLQEYNRIQREKRANRTENQRNKDLEYAKKYRQLNKDKIRQYQKSISDRRKITKKICHHKRYRTDIQYKMLHNLRSRIKNVLKCKAKDSTTLKLLGCTMSFFKEYIENKFVDNMSWDKILDGSIHIDHIKPCSMFDLGILEEQKKCFHYTNLQPLWAEDNLKKSNKIIYV